jgi:hypothetical protein
MDIQELAQSFLSSEHGQQALAALTQQGMSEDDATTALTHSVAAGADHVHNSAESSGILGEHPGRNFFAAFAAGLVKGDSVMDALEDGAAGVITAKVTEVLCDKMGLDPNTAATIAATATPYVMGFLREHLKGN